MALTLETLVVLDAIDRRGSFAAAAKELGHVPSGITYLVRRAEEELDVLLFDRSGHRARLTAAGAELLRDGRQVLRQADELERRVRRISRGWEDELRIAMDDVLKTGAILDLLAEFYAEEPGTRVRLTSEVLTGTWEALVAGRCDLALGASMAASVATASSGSFSFRPLGEVEMVFAVAPAHPLAAANEPIPIDAVRGHRAVAVGDTAQNLPRQTVNLLAGQDVLTVASMQAKLMAQLAGLGCGYLPLGLALPHLQAGRLVAKLTTQTRLETALHYAWNNRSEGRAMRWFLERLEVPERRQAFLP